VFNDWFYPNLRFLENLITIMKNTIFFVSYWYIRSNLSTRNKKEVEGKASVILGVSKIHEGGDMNLGP
jgi:hypothetical protein